MSLRADQKLGRRGNPAYLSSHENITCKILFVHVNIGWITSSGNPLPFS